MLLEWTLHARAKMSYYRLSPGRVRRVLQTPTRVEEGVAPKTVAMMQPASLKSAPAKHGLARGRSLTGVTARGGKWTQEIWVMVQDVGKRRKVISAWRYPGVTKPRSSEAIAAMRKELAEFVAEEGS